MYRTDVYFLSKTFADLPIYILFPFFFVTIPYFAIGLNPDPGAFFTAVIIVILVANVATSFGKWTVNEEINTGQSIIISNALSCRVFHVVHSIQYSSCISYVRAVDHSDAALWRIFLEERFSSDLLWLVALCFMVHVRKRSSFHQSMVGDHFQRSTLSGRCLYPTSHFGSIWFRCGKKQLQ